MARKGKAGNGEGTIYQRKRDGKWIAELTVGWKATGRREILRSPGLGKRREAADWLAARQAERQKGELVKPTKQTVGQFLRQWLDTTVAHQVKPSTLHNYRQMVEYYLDRDIGQQELTKLTPREIQTMYHKRLQAGLSARTVQLMHAVLRRALQQAVEWQLVPRNVADAVKKPRLERKETVALTPDQVVRFLDAAQADRLHALYVLAVTVGLRLGELLGLRWSDVDLEAGTLNVRQTLAVIKGRWLFGSPKTATSRRTIDLPAVAINALKRWHREQGAERLKIGEAWAYPDLVFATRIGTPLNPSNVRNRSFGAILQRAGCPRVRFHDLRHTAATLMAAQGVRARTLQDVLGHSDIRLTLGLYSHVLREQKKEAARKIDAFLAASQKQ